MTGSVEYLQRVTRIQHLAREYWFELLIAVMAIAGMLELDRRSRLAGRPDARRCGSRRRDRGSRAAALRASPVSLCRPGRLLGPGRRPHASSTDADPVPRQPERRRAGDRVPARKSARRKQAGSASRSSPGRIADRRPQHPGPADGEPVHLPHPPVRGRLDRRLCAARTLRAGRSSRNPRSSSRARARGGRARRGGGGALADRPRAPRHRRPRRQRHGAPGRRRQAQAAGCDGRGSRCASGRRARRPDGPRRDAPSPRRHAPRRRRSRARPSARPRWPQLTAGGGRPCRTTRRAAPRRPAVPAPARARPLGVSHRSGGPDQRAQARARERRGRDRPLQAGRGRDRGPRQRRGHSRRATAWDTGSSGFASASRSTAAR